MNESQSSKLTPAEWAKAIFAHWRAQQQPGSSKSEETFAAAAKLSRGGYRKVVDGKNRPRFDTIQKLRRIAPMHLKNMEPTANGDVSGVESSLPAHENSDGGYEVTTPEGQMVGRELDEIDDLDLRKRARTAALAAIDTERAKSNPSLPVAGKSGTARRRS